MWSLWGRLALLRAPTAASSGDGSEGSGSLEPACPSERGGLQRSVHCHEQITEGHTLQFTHTQAPRSMKRRPGKHNLHPPSCSLHVTCGGVRKLLGLCVWREDLLAGVCRAVVCNHVTEQHPLPLVSLFQKLLEECSSRNHDFGPAQRQTLQASLLHCSVALRFTPALHRPLLLLPWPSSRAFLLYVYCLIFWHLPPRFEASANLLLCPEHIDCPWPLRTAVEGRKARSYSPFESVLFRLTICMS